MKAELLNYVLTTALIFCIIITLGAKSKSNGAYSRSIISLFMSIIQPRRPSPDCVGKSMTLFHLINTHRVPF